MAVNGKAVCRLELVLVMRHSDKEGTHISPDGRQATGIRAKRRNRVPVRRPDSPVTGPVTDASTKPTARVGYSLAGGTLALLLVTERAAHSWRGIMIRCKMSVFCSVLFLSLPRSEGWPHHGPSFSIYLYPLSF